MSGVSRGLIQVAVLAGEASEKWAQVENLPNNRCETTKTGVETAKTGVETAKTGVETALSQQLPKKGVETSQQFLKQVLILAEKQKEVRV